MEDVARHFPTENKVQFSPHRCHLSTLGSSVHSPRYCLDIQIAEEICDMGVIWGGKWVLGYKFFFFFYQKQILHIDTRTNTFTNTADSQRKVGWSPPVLELNLLQITPLHSWGTTWRAIQGHKTVCSPAGNQVLEKHNSERLSVRPKTCLRV